MRNVDEFAFRFFRDHVQGIAESIEVRSGKTNGRYTEDQIEKLKQLTSLLKQSAEIFDDLLSEE